MVPENAVFKQTKFLGIKFMITFSCIWFEIIWCDNYNTIFVYKSWNADNALYAKDCDTGTESVMMSVVDDSSRL